MTSSSRTLQHVGEWKVEARGTTVEDLFIEVARVIATAAGEAHPTSGSHVWERVELEARDLATLLVDWGNELIGLGEVSERGYATVRDLHVARKPSGAVGLAAEVAGDPVEPWISPLKAATYHGAVVEHDDRDWRGVVLFDV